MKKYSLMFAGAMSIIFSLSFPSALLAEEGQMHEMKAHDMMGMEHAAEKVVVDPVCGMTIKPEEAAGKVEYKGTTYYFCMDADREAFEKDPEKYIAKMGKKEEPKEMPMGHEGMEGEHHEMEEHEHEMMHGSHWMAPEAEAKKPNPVEPTEESLARAAEVFKEKCVLCHGEGGAGNGALADSLNPKPADLAGEMARMHSDGDLFYKISKGKGAMPAWEPMLSAEERWGLVNYIRTLGK